MDRSASGLDVDDSEFEFDYHFNNHLILFNPFFRCLLLIEKRCLSVRLLTEPHREEVHCQTIQIIKW